VAAERNGKPDREQVLAATADERTELPDRYRDTARATPASMICFDVGCWQPDKESFEEFVARKRRAWAELAGDLPSQRDAT
jgi:hypothetical protein